MLLLLLMQLILLLAELYLSKQFVISWFSQARPGNVISDQARPVQTRLGQARPDRDRPDLAGPYIFTLSKFLDMS